MSIAQWEGMMPNLSQFSQWVLAMWVVLYFVVGALVLAALVKMFALASQMRHHMVHAESNRKLAKRLLRAVKAWLDTHESKAEENRREIKQAVEEVPAKVKEELKDASTGKPPA